MRQPDIQRPMHYASRLPEYERIGSYLDVRLAEEPDGEDAARDPQADDERGPTGHHACLYALVEVLRSGSTCSTQADQSASVCRDWPGTRTRSIACARHHLTNCSAAEWVSWIWM